MTTTTQESLTAALQQKKYSTFIQNIARKLVLKQLQSLQYGRLEIIELFKGGDSNPITFGHTGISATIEINDAHFYGEIAFGGSIGAAEARSKSVV